MSEEQENQTPVRNTAHEFGVVVMKEWMQNPITGNSVNAVGGPIKLLTAKESFGFTPKGNEANWGVLVGSEGASQVLLLGCQIRAVMWGPKTKLPGDGVNAWVLQ